MASQAIDILTQGKGLRVWSFIVTLFGDLARGPHDTLSGTTLTIMTGRVGIKPASMRVALHRLRKDGWIDSRRDGRSSLYYLTKYGRAETLAATRRIYAPQPVPADEWHIALTPTGPKAPALPGIQILPGVSLGAGAAPEIDGALTLTGALGTVPDWVRKSLVSDDLRRDYAQFEAQLAKLAPLLEAPLPALDRAVLRGLIVHDWRRLLLRHPDLPDDFLGPDCRIGPCRAQVMDLLARLGNVQPEEIAA